MEKHAFDPACCLGERLQTLSRAELTALAETICRILTERGAYHGGIRPDNISRAGDGTVGLGAPARTDTKDWTTEELEFMAPEVFWSGSLDASADVYSLGLLLYAGVMGGRLPFYPDDRAPQPEDMGLSGAPVCVAYDSTDHQGKRQGDGFGERRGNPFCCHIFLWHDHRRIHRHGRILFHGDTRHYCQHPVRSIAGL